MLLQAPAGPYRFDQQTTPEIELAVALEGLSTKGQYKTDPMFLQPLQRWKGFGYKKLSQLGIGQSFGDAHEIVVEFILAVLADLDRGLFLGCHVGAKFCYVLHATG